MRVLPFVERRKRLEAFCGPARRPKVDLSPTSPSMAGTRWPRRAEIQRGAGAGEDAEAVEGVMLKRRDVALSAGPPERPLVEVEARPVHHRCRPDVCPAWPRQALVVLFGLHFRRLDFGEDGEHWCRSARPISASPTRSWCRSTALSAATPSNRFGPVRDVTHGRTRAWCLKSPSRACNARRGTNPASRCVFRASPASRWDKPPREADRLETLVRMIERPNVFKRIGHWFA